MKIAYLVPRCLTSNSHGRYVLELVHAIGPRHDVSVFSSAFPREALPARTRRLPLPDRPAVARVLSWWAVARSLVGRGRFDVVHTQGGDAPVGTVVTAPCCNQAIRLALEAAGEGASGYGRRRALSINRVNVRLMEVADRFCMTRPGVRRIIVPSRHVGDELTGLYGVDAGKLALVPHGIDLEAFSSAVAHARRAASRARYGFGGADLVGVYVGGAYRLKGLPPLLEALRRVADPRLRLLAVGVTEDAELVGERARGLQGRVVFTGHITDMAGAYAAGDFFVLPTLYDSFSLAALEAMACGLPVIVSDRAGVVDLLHDGHDAIVLRHPDDPAETASAIEKLAADPAWQAALGREARTTALRYSSAEMARRTVAVYEAVA